MALLAISWPVAAYIFLVAAIVFALLAAFMPYWLPMDPEGMNDDEEQPTLDVQNHKGD